MKTMSIVGAIALAAGLVPGTLSTALGGIFFETESNNTIGTADPLGSYSFPGDGLLVDGEMTSGDVDWFEISFTDTTQLVVSAFALPVSNNDTDGQLELVDSTGAIIAFDDDSNIGFMPALQATVAAGTYYIGLSGFDDGNLASGTPTLFDGVSNGGPHTENWLYKLVIGANVAPAPGAAALVGIAGLMASRRRR